MKKRIFIALAILAGSAAYAQKKPKQPPPPPPPPMEDLKQIPPPPPPPPPPVRSGHLSSTVQAQYKAFLEKHPSVKNIEWSDKTLVRIHLKSGKEEVYDLNKEEDAQRLKNKYGELPTPPPPPPAPKTPRTISES